MDYSIVGPPAWASNDTPSLLLQQQPPPPPPPPPPPKHLQPRRSARIDKKQWDQYRPLLCELYRTHTLDNVKVFMNERFGFNPSKRQYGYQFGKWQFRKYAGAGASNRTLAENPGNQNGGPANESNDGARTHFSTKALEIIETLESAGRYGHGYGLSPGSLSDDGMSCYLSDGDNGDFPPDSPSYLFDFPWTPEEKLRLAAESCLAVSDDKNGFELFYGIYESKTDDPEVGEAVKDRLLISCARTAGNPKDIAIVRQLLAVHKHRSQSRRLLADFIVPMLEAYVDERSEEALAADVQNRVCALMKAVDFSDPTAPFSERRCTVIDLVAYHLVFYGSRIFEDSGQEPTFSLENMLLQYVSCQPLFDSLRRNETTELKCCIEWCVMTLDRQVQVPAGFHDLPCDVDQRLWLDNTKLFCALWEAMLLSVQQSPGSTPSWYVHCESSFGISPAEFLVTVCSLLCNRIHIEDDENVIVRAATNAKVLSDTPEPILWTHFLTELGKMNQPVTHRDQDLDFEKHMLASVREFLCSKLDVCLPWSSFDYDQEIPQLHLGGEQYLQTLDFDVDLTGAGGHGIPVDEFEVFKSFDSHPPQ